MLMSQGVRDFQPARRNWADRLERLGTGDGRALPPALKAEVERECRRLWQVIEMVRTVECERDAARAADEPDRVGMLTRLGALGAVSASVLVDEVFHRDFANRREVAGYVGLGSSPYNSGSVQRDQGISRAGTHARASSRSSWPGSGCAISPGAGWRAGSTSASARPAASSSGS